MTALHSFLAAYLTGVAWLLLLGYDRVYLVPLAAAVRDVATRRYRYEGRHWADGLSTMQLVDQLRAEREVLGRACTEPTHEMFLPDFDGDVGPYQPKAGVARYNHLSPGELAARAAHEQRAFELGVNLAALRVPVPVDDEWVAA